MAESLRGWARATERILDKLVGTREALGHQNFALEWDIDHTAAVVGIADAALAVAQPDLQALIEDVVGIAVAHARLHLRHRLVRPADIWRARALVSGQEA